MTGYVAKFCCLTSLRHRHEALPDAAQIAGPLNCQLISLNYYIVLDDVAGYGPQAQRIQNRR